MILNIIKKIVLLFFLFSFTVYSQIKASRVEYSLVVGDDKELDNGPMADYYKEAKNNAKYVSFSLDFDENAMIFYENKKINDENNNTSFSVAFSGVLGKYYREKKSDVILNEINNKMGNFIIKTNDATKWILTKENKKIQKYLCYKATASLVIKNQAGTFKRPIIAWYCPQIPVSFGPKGYTGLPGLIMEFQDKNIIIGATKIELKTKFIKIEQPKNAKVITEEDYNKIVEVSTQNMED